MKPTNHTKSTNHTKPTNHALIVIGLQTEMEDTNGGYQKTLEFVRNAIAEKRYDKVIAIKYFDDIGHPTSSKPSNSSKPSKPSNPSKPSQILEFKPDITIIKSMGKLFNFKELFNNYHYDIVGCNTEDMILKTSLDMIDDNYEFNLLIDYCFSTNGTEQHQRAINILKPILGNSFVTEHQD